MATRKIHHSQGGDADRQPVNRNRRQFIKAGAAARRRRFVRHDVWPGGKSCVGRRDRDHPRHGNG
jgi:hypothetical protein